MERRETTNEKLVVDGKPCTPPQIATEINSLQEITSMGAVFAIPLLMDKIIKYSVYNSNGKLIDKPTVIAIRLVNNSWLQSTSRVLKVSGDWAIQIFIGDYHGSSKVNNTKYDNKKGNILDNFIAVFSKASRSFNSILPISLNIEQLDLENDSGKKLVNFFEQCSDIICDLSLNYSNDCGSLLSKYNHLKFPILQTVSFVFITLKNVHRLSSIAIVDSSNTNGLKCLQKILQNSRNLKYLTLKYDSKAAINVSTLTLPQTLKILALHCPFNNAEWELLTKHKLPYLDVLKLTICNEPEENLIHKILQHFQSQLKRIKLSIDETSNDICTTIRIPIMSKLQLLHISGEEFDLFPPLRRVWPDVVPNLTSLLLEDMTESKFFEWVQGSRFENVDNLLISLECTDEDGYQIVMSPSVQIFREIITSFPELQVLTLHINLDDARDMKYLFKNFPHLKTLQLNFDVDDSADCGLPGYKIVSILLGISLQLATAIVNEPDKNVKITIDSPDSIMNLTDLTNLTLCTLELDSSERDEDPFCSDFITQYFQNKMPKLVKIDLLDGFKPGPRPIHSACSSD